MTISDLIKYVPDFGGARRNTIGIKINRLNLSKQRNDIKW